MSAVLPANVHIQYIQPFSWVCYSQWTLHYKFYCGAVTLIFSKRIPLRGQPIAVVLQSSVSLLDSSCFDPNNYRQSPTHPSS